MFADDALTEDGFLGGRLRVLQPRSGYRAATDPVLLAAAVAARAGERVLDLGCGAGVASLCLAQRVAGLELWGVELQADYADLARRNAARNGVTLRVVDGDLAAMPAGIRALSFDQVLANPPYFPPSGGTAAEDAGRERAQREATPLGNWIDAGVRRLKPGGWLTLIQLAERLPAVLDCLGGQVGSVAVLPLAARSGRAANRVIVRARKGARGPFVLHAPFVLHDGAEHDGDRDTHSAMAREVLRNAAVLPFGD